MRKIKGAFLFLALSVSTTSFAQFEDFLKGGTADANILLNHYTTPLLKGMGYGFNNGWYNTAKPHELFGFDLTISANAAIVPEADQTFIFDNNEYGNTKLRSGASTAILPTLMGNDTDELLLNYIDSPFNPGNDLPIGYYEAPDGIADDIKSELEIDQVAIPSPIVQIGLGLVKGTEIKLRWLPTINVDDFNYKYFGIGGLHSISQWLPGIKDIEFLDISAFVGYTKVSAGYLIPPGNMEGENQSASLAVNTFTYQILASASISVISGYIGLGMDNYNTTFKMLGTYDPYPLAPIPDEERILTDPIDLRASGNNGFRTTFGARLKLAIITLHFDYTIREYNTMTAGIGFSYK